MDNSENITSGVAFQGGGGDYAIHWRLALRFCQSSEGGIQISPNTNYQKFKKA